MKDTKINSHIIFIVMLLLVLTAIYSPLVNIGRLSDDFSLLRIHSLKDVLSSQGGWAFRFIGNLSVFLDYRLYGTSYQWYHVTSISIQLVNVVLFYLILGQIESNKWIVRFGTAIYAFHFANTASTAWLSDRWTLLSAMFGLVSVLLFVKYGKSESSRYKFSSIFFFLLALMTKESTLSILPIMVAYLWIYSDTRFSISLDSIMITVKTLAFYLVLTCLYLFLRFFWFKGGAYPVYLTKVFLGPIFFASYAFAPFDIYEALQRLGIDSNSIRIYFSEHVAARAVVAFCVIFMVFATASRLKKQKKLSLNKLELFGLAWFASSIIPYMAWFDTRWLNPATAGVAIFMSGLLSRMIRTTSETGDCIEINKGTHRRTSACLAISLIVLMIISTVVRVQSFTDASHLVSSILHQTKTLIPAVPENSLIVMVNPPDLYRNVFIFRNGLKAALRELYKKPSLVVVQNELVGKRNRPLDDKEADLFIINHQDIIRQSSLRGGEVHILRFDEKTLSVNSVPFKLQ